MKIGSRIREERIKKKMTQSALVGDKITRNMLSAIENEKATPSLETLVYISNRLELPVTYFLTEAETAFNLKKAQNIEKIKIAYREKRFLDCIELIETLSEVDDELSLMLAFSYFETGKHALFSGALLSAQKKLDTCERYCSKTIYDTTRIRSVLPIYKAVAKNIQSPLLELDYKALEKNEQFTADYEFYKYITLDMSFDYKNPFFKSHISAKAMMRERNYITALKLLKQLENEKTPASYNAYSFFSIYSDMETCYRQLGDFENAYRYSTKRLSMLEGFKT
jgi:transcriptional regulator with XRE-family HTH domain